MNPGDLPPIERVRQTILTLCDICEKLMAVHEDVHREIERVVDLKSHEQLRTKLGGVRAIHDQGAATIENVRREFKS
jgi:hypothetical protein